MATNTSAVKFQASRLQDRISLDTRASLRNLSAFTWQAWVKPGSNPNQYQRAYVEHQGGAGAGKTLLRFAVAPVNGVLRFELGPIDGKTDTNYSFPFNWGDRWHHVAFAASLSQENWAIVLDGIKVVEGSLVGVAHDAANNNNPLPIANTDPGIIEIGAHKFNAQTPWYFWDGKIDEIQIYQVKRNESDILATMNNHGDVSGNPDLLYNWRFNEGTGEGAGPLSTGDSDHVFAVDGVDYLGTLSSAVLWTTDRPFLGDGAVDVSAPTQPGALTISNVTTTSFTVSWGASTDNVFVQRYELEVSESSDFSAYTIIQPGRALSWTVTGRQPLTGYYVRVRAFDAQDNASAYRTGTGTPHVTTVAIGDLYAPPPPTLQSASAVTFSGFTVTWAASVDDPRSSSGIGGYKLDVSSDPNFVTFLTGYRNKDVGNVTSHAVVGATPNTRYYVRARAYDVAQNESSDSGALVVSTLPLPDVTPPNIVVARAPSSVTATSFVANWDEGIDDVGVIGYRLDVATAIDFSAFVTGYQDRDVGNVVALNIPNLTPATTYWYRVRAYDAAGNRSDNSAEPVAATTEQSSLDALGVLPVSFEPTADAYVDSAASATNFGSAQTLQIGGTKETYLQFDLTSAFGTLDAAALRLWVQATGGAITIQRCATAINETTLTYATRPSVTGPTLSFTPLAVGQWVEVDVASLLTLGPAIYTLRLSGGTATFAAKEDAAGHRPLLATLINPNDATEPRTITLTPGVGGRKNWIANPSFEVGTTGWTARNGATLARVATFATVGAAGLAITCNGSQAGQGVQTNLTAFPARQNDVWTISFDAKVSAGSVPVTLHISERDQNGQGVRDDNTTLTLTTTVQRFSRTYRPSSPDCRFLFFEIFTNNAVSVTINADAFLAEQTATARSYFDGSFATAIWLGAAHNSASSMGETTLAVASTYVGDNDGDNSVAVQFRRSGTTDWVQPATLAPTLDRAAKRVTATIGPTYLDANLIPNGGFEYGATDWTPATAPAGITVTRGVSQVHASLGRQAYLVDVTANAGAANATISAAPSFATITASQFYTAGVDYLTTNASLVPALRFDWYTSAGAFISGVTMPSSAIADGAFHRHAASVLAPATAGRLIVSLQVISASTGAVGSVWFDNVQLNRGAVANPYLDGDLPDGVWRGAIGASITDRVILAETNYDVQLVFVDPDGVIGTNPIGGVARTAVAPDLALTTGALVAVIDNDALHITASYTGDDDATATAVVEWRRADLTVWSLAAAAIDRDDKIVTASIRNLQPGTAYAVRVTFADTPWLYGPNPLTATFTTDTAGVLSEGKERITFGGFVIHSDQMGASYFVTEHDGVFGFPERRLDIQTLSRDDGAVELGHFWGERKITMRGMIEGSSRADLEAKVRALKDALGRPQQRLVIDTMSVSKRYFTASVDSFAMPEVGGEASFLKWDATFRCADPFAYANDDTVDAFTAINGQVVKVTNDGGVQVSPTLTIKTTNTVTPITVVVTNKSTGERIAPVPTILSGDRLVIDNGGQSVAKNGVRVDANGGFLRLAPGVNELLFTIAPATGTAGSSQISVDIRRRNRWL